MHRQTPTRSTWRTRMKSSSSYSSRGTYGPGTPALLCAASSLPKTAAASSTAAVTARRSVTSATNTTARWPAAFTVPAVSSRPSASMSISATEAPAAANAMALALPIPEAAPVISTARPDMSAGMCPPKPPRFHRAQGPGSSTVVVPKGRAQDSAGTMQQDSLVLGRDVQGSADFFGCHPADVAHGYHAALARRQCRYGPVEQAQDLLGQHHAFRACVPPGRGVDGRPLPGVLASGDADPVICRPFLRVQRPGKRPGLAGAAGSGPVDEDRECPCPQRRPALELRQAGEHPEPGLLDDVLRGLRAADERPRDAEHGRRPLIHQLGDRRFVTCPQLHDKVGIGVGVGVLIGLRGFAVTDLWHRGRLPVSADCSLAPGACDAPPPSPHLIRVRRSATLSMSSAALPRLQGGEPLGHGATRIPALSVS